MLVLIATNGGRRERGTSERKREKQTSKQTDKLNIIPLTSARTHTHIAPHYLSSRSRDTITLSQRPFIDRKYTLCLRCEKFKSCHHLFSDGISYRSAGNSENTILNSGAEEERFTYNKSVNSDLSHFT